MGNDLSQRPHHRTPLPVLTAERLWSLRKSGQQVDCELRFDNETTKWECQCLYNCKPVSGRRFLTREGALAEAARERDRLKRDGWNAATGANDVSLRHRFWPFRRSKATAADGR